MDAFDEKSEAISSFRWLKNQRIIFLLSFLVGTVLLIVLRESGAQTWISILAAAFVMGLYALYGSIQKYLMRPDILGDNLYYLGFLFTLVSLAHTLYRYSSNQSQIDLIIQNFGIALSTTLIGLVLRVFFGQAKQDNALYERSIQLSLSEAAANLIGEISTIRQDLSILKTSMVQTVNEGVEASVIKFNDQLNETNTKISAAIDTTFKTVESSLQQAAQSFSSSTEIISQRQNETTSLSRDGIASFNGFVAEFITDLKGLTANIKKLDSLDSHIQKKVITPLNTMSEALIKLETVIEKPVVNLENLSTLTDKANSALDNFTTNSLSKLNEQILKSDSTVTVSLQKLEEIFEKHKQISDAIKNIALQMPESLESVEAIYKSTSIEIQSAVKQSNESLLALEESLIKVTEKIRESIK